MSQIVHFLKEVCLLFSFQFLTDKIEKSKNIIVNFIIQKLKSKHTSLKKYTNWDKLCCLSLYIFEGMSWNIFHIFRFSGHSGLFKMNLIGRFALQLKSFLCNFIKKLADLLHFFSNNAYSTNCVFHLNFLYFSLKF